MSKRFFAFLLASLISIFCMFPLSNILNAAPFDLIENPESHDEYDHLKEIDPIKMVLSEYQKPWNLMELKVNTRGEAGFMAKLLFPMENLGSKWNLMVGYEMISRSGCFSKDDSAVKYFWVDSLHGQKEVKLGEKFSVERDVVDDGYLKVVVLNNGECNQVNLTLGVIGKRIIEN